MNRTRSVDDKKRQRKSSSDSEPSPAAKQTKMAGADSKAVDLQTIRKAVQGMQASQESLKTFFDNRFQTLKTDITKEMIQKWIH